VVTNVPPSVPPSVPPPPAVGAPQKRARPRPTPKVILVLVLIAASIWFIAVNTHEQKVTLWIPTVEAPTWLVLLVTIIVGIVIGWSVGQLRRRRRMTR